ncbi:hypothetical protein R3I94_010120 [Phoxinus phoxinus]
MMGSFQPAYFQILYLLISALSECKAQTVTCKQIHRLNINYVQGDNMSISCLTTTHQLESLTVELRRNDTDKHILKYPDNSPALEHQRWSVRNDTGNVTLYLKDIRASDDGLYDCQVYNDRGCLNATQFNLSVIKCKKLDSVHATSKTSVLLPCSEHLLQNRTDQVTWKIVTGYQSKEIDKHRPTHKPSNSTERDSRPLYERVRTLGNGSLLIRDAVNTDGSWYRCRVSEKTCYEVKLVIKDYGVSHSTTKLETLSTTCPACSPVVIDDSDASAEVTANLTAVVMVTIVSLCVLITLIICVILYFKKRQSKFNRQTTSNCQFSAFYSQIAEGFDVPEYSLVERSTRTMTTFVAEQAEAPACIVNHNIYEM